MDEGENESGKVPIVWDLWTPPAFFLTHRTQYRLLSDRAHDFSSLKLAVSLISLRETWLICKREANNFPSHRFDRSTIYKTKAPSNGAEAQRPLTLLYRHSNTVVASLPPVFGSSSFMACCFVRLRLSSRLSALVTLSLRKQIHHHFITRNQNRQKCVDSHRHRWGFQFCRMSFL